jgi:hypothetical protein
MARDGQHDSTVAAVAEPRRSTLLRRPLHLRLREQILRDLVKADLTPGQRYSTEGELADRFRVSRNTLRKAMAGLEKDGYLSRRRRIGTIAGRRPLPGEDAVDSSASASPSGVSSRQRILAVLPAWDDSLEGRFSGQLLRALASPELSPPLAVEIRHPNDRIEMKETASALVLAIDPRGRAVYELQEIARLGARVVAFAPCIAWPEFAMIAGDRRDAVRQAVHRLYELGHRAVGLMNNDLAHMEFSETLLGYLDAHRELDRPIPPGGIVQHVPGQPDILEPDVKSVSAWICAYIGAVSIVAGNCRRQGLSIPRDVSIVTLDDPGDVVLQELGAPVTGVRQNFKETAAAIHALAVNWREEQRGAVIHTTSEWIERGTVAPPAP